MRHLVIDEIAREAGISKGSFYSFFPSREDFILTIFEAWESEYRSSLLAEVSGGSGSPRERLERFVLGVFEIFEREPGMALINPAEIERIIEALPAERVAGHMAADKLAMSEAIGGWAASGIVHPDDIGALQGLLQALFAMALFKESFPLGSFAPTAKLLAEAIAMRLCREPEGGAHD
jgi:AcrR family transcriptional regulator